jgi:hypothetical protein
MINTTSFERPTTTSVLKLKITITLGFSVEGLKTDLEGSVLPLSTQKCSKRTWEGLGCGGTLRRPLRSLAAVTPVCLNRAAVISCSITTALGRSRRVKKDMQSPSYRAL